MSENVISYLIYLLVIAAITFYVGQVLYKNGRHFLIDIFNGDIKTVDPVNKILLTGYYLINLGYAMLMITQWRVVSNYKEMIEYLAENVGEIVLTLAVLHYFNILAFSLYKYFKTHRIFNSKI